MTTQAFDLLSTSASGGCSAKLDPTALTDLLKTIPLMNDPRIMVDIAACDDAGVYRLNDETALIVTTDFFPPMCSDAYTFGQIAATNALSDVYAMGGTPLLTMNITMFPSKDFPMEVLRDILAGGQERINTSGAFNMGGHTIDDAVPKYGLSVVGTVHPDKLITNAGMKPGQMLLLTKPLGTGILMAAHRLGLSDAGAYEAALQQMLMLNREGASAMQACGVTGATDVTGFRLLGHAMSMARSSGVSIDLQLGRLPVLPQVQELLRNGCIPGGAFRNAKYVKDAVLYAPSCTVEQKMLACDAQTSGGLLVAVDADKVDAMLALLLPVHPQTAVVGEVTTKRNRLIYCR